MRHFSIGLITLLLTVCLCLWGARTLSGRTTALYDQIAAVRVLHDADPARAAPALEAAAEAWDRERPLFDALMNHQLVTEISLSLSDLRNAEARDFPGLCDRLLLMLAQLSELQKPCLHNIL